VTEDEEEQRIVMKRDMPLDVTGALRATIPVRASRCDGRRGIARPSALVRIAKGGVRFLGRSDLAADAPFDEGVRLPIDGFPLYRELNILRAYELRVSSAIL